MDTKRDKELPEKTLTLNKIEKNILIVGGTGFRLPSCKKMSKKKF